MTRRYFTCPIQALYMMREFGVKFIVGDQGHYNYETCLPYTIEHLSKREKFYVAKESEEIFRVKEKDLITDGWQYGEVCSKSPYEDLVAFSVGEEGETSTVRESELKIIMRNNKNFFNGELENDK